jgi:hypothetical protein
MAPKKPKVIKKRLTHKSDTTIKKVSIPATHHVVVAFEGFNIPLFQNAGNEIPLDTKDNRVVDIVNQATSDLPEEAVSKIAYSTDFTEVARNKAVQFIKSHLKVENGKQYGKLVIYGYSMGGDSAIELAAKLKGQYVVDLLVTVDAATGANIGVDRTIPSNVRKNINFWTKNPQTSLGQHGGPNHAEQKRLTDVYNFPRHEESHGSIAKATKDASIQHMKEALKRKTFVHVPLPLKLTFDGSAVIVTNPNDQKEIARFPAVSGLPAHAPHLKELIDTGRKDLDINTDYRHWKYQHVADAGPIVEDHYSLPVKAGMPFDKTSRDGAGWGLGGWKLGTSILQDLSIYFGGRGGFFLHHDGGSPGTAGCIGIIKPGDFKKLRQLLIEAGQAGQDKVDVHVIYEKK